MKLILSSNVGEQALDRLGAALAARLGPPQHRSARALWYRNVADEAQLRQWLASSCDTENVDHAWMSENSELAAVGLVAMDMDSTLITIECIDEIADFIGKKPEIAAITEATMRGDIADFAESLKRRVALLAGTPEEVLDAVYAERLALSDGATQLLAALKKASIPTLLVSGGFTFFTDRLKERLGLDFAAANTLEIESGRLTGRLTGRIVDAQRKATALSTVCEHLGVAATSSVVLGDGANDLPMMARAGMSIAYHAKPAVRAAASHAIQFGGLDVMLDWFAPIPSQ